MAERSRFDIGKVLSKALGVMGANLPLFLAIAAPLTGATAFLAHWWSTQYMTGLTPQEMFAVVQTREFLQPMGMVWAIGVVTGSVVHAALTRATVKSLGGQVPGLGESLEAGFALLLPVILVSVIVSIGVTLGLLLLVVPGIILALCWSMAIPVVVQERLGPLKALDRSLALTRGERGNIFLLLLVMTIGLWIFGAVVGLIGGIFTGGSPVGLALVQALISAVSAMTNTAVTATAYVELRSAKEGGGASELETVFS